MKKLPQYNDEINLSSVFLSIWREKLIIFLIMLITITTVIIYSNYKPKLITHKISLEVKLGDKSIFDKFLFINKIPFESTNNTNNIVKNKIKISQIDEIMALNSFVSEFLDYKEVISVLKKNDYIQKDISQLSKGNKEKRLREYASLFTLEKIKETSNFYTVNFRWRNIDEGIKIIEDTFKLVKSNVHKLAFKKVNDRLRLVRAEAISNDLKKIEFLKEQSAIAKELNLVEGQIDENTGYYLRGINDNTAYYLRGYKAIDKEIDLILNRKYLNLINIEKEAELLKKEDYSKWVDYDLDLATVESSSSNNFWKNFNIAVIVGLIIGLFYVFIVNNALLTKLFQPQRITNRKTK